MGQFCRFEYKIRFDLEKKWKSIDQYYKVNGRKKLVFNISCSTNEEDEKVALKFS